MKLNIKLIVCLCATALVALAAESAMAKLSQADADHLGKDLTPLGGEVIGNKEGSIPAYTGGLTTAPAGWDKASGYVDPFIGEKPKFVINAANAEQYKANLPAGALALLKKYPTFNMPVYPTHRTAAVPKVVADLVKTQAMQTEMMNGVGIANLNGTTTPFPIPKSGVEAIVNHNYRYLGGGYERAQASFPIRNTGEYFRVGSVELRVFEANMDQKHDERRFSFISYFTAPATLVGTVFLVHEPADYGTTDRMAWIYNAGQRRVRRAPDLAYDAVNDGTEGMRVTDQYDGYNGAVDRYDWKLVGKKEMIVPYNAYKLASKSMKYSDILTKNHMKPELTRYELHRVWVVEATVKAGQKHVYGKRTFLLDEDSWNVLWEDAYDSRGDLWRVGVHSVVQYYDAGVMQTVCNAWHDLTNGNYMVGGLDNEEKSLIKFGIKGRSADFTPDALRRTGTK